MATYTDIQTNVSQSNRRTFKTAGSADEFYHKEGYLVKIAGVDSNGKATVDLADATTDKPIGILLHGPTAVSTGTVVDVDVIMCGQFTFRAICGAAAITAGDQVAVENATGKVQTAATTQWPIGIALNSAVAGDTVEILASVANIVKV